MDTTFFHRRSTASNRKYQLMIRRRSTAIRERTENRGFRRTSVSRFQIRSIAIPKHERIRFRFRSDSLAAINVALKHFENRYDQNGETTFIFVQGFRCMSYDTRGKKNQHSVPVRVVFPVFFSLSLPPSDSVFLTAAPMVYCPEAGKIEFPPREECVCTILYLLIPGIS